MTQTTQTAPTLKTGMVLFCDALGIRDMSDNDCVEYINKKDKLIADCIGNWQEVLKHAGVPQDKSSMPNMELKIFGDSFIFYWELPKIEMQPFLYISSFAVALIERGLKNGFYLRGAMSYGKYIADDKVIIGEALFDAYNWHDKTNWFGVIATPKFGVHISYLTNKSSMPDIVVCDVRIPCWIKYPHTPIKDKTGKTQQSNDYWVLDWPFAFLADHPFEEATVNSYNNFLVAIPKTVVPHGVEDKLFNAIEFFKYSSKECVEHYKNIGLKKKTDAPKT